MKHCKVFNFLKKIIKYKIINIRIVWISFIIILNINLYGNLIYLYSFFHYLNVLILYECNIIRIILNILSFFFNNVILCNV